MVFHRANPANFTGKGGTDYDPEIFDAGVLRAELSELAGHCCLEHASAIVDKVLERYHVTRRDRSGPL